MDWDAFYRIARKDGEFYVVDEDGEPLNEEPMKRVEISHLSAFDCDHFSGRDLDGELTILSKDAQDELTSEQKNMIRFIIE